MACEDSINILEGKTCSCCLCRCGDHECLQQMTLKLPLAMQLELQAKGMTPQEKKREKVTPEQAELYSRTTYRTDFCEQRDIIDEFPLEQKGLVTSLKVRSGHVAKDSTYKADFTPWRIDEQELFRGKLYVPDHLLERVPEDGRGERCSEKIFEKLCNYYCPPHCIGVEEEEPKENCLIDFKEKFNIGPPKCHKKDVPDKPHQPFTKFTNYRLDYRGGAIPPRHEDKKVVEVPRVQQTMERDTSYRSAYTCPPEDCFTRKPKEEKTSAAPQDGISTSQEPMQQDTTSMLDFKDPEVAAHKPTKPPRESFFRPPRCPMETETTTGRSYPRWKHIQDKGKEKIPESTCRMQREDDVRRLVTTYQEDFKGLNRALCLCTVVEKHGPKVLEPRFCLKESNEQPHEFFDFSRTSEPTTKECFH